MAKRKAVSASKIFVLDTSVILFDHHAIENFEDNDVAIPIMVLEELDNFKKGNDTKNFEAREFIRYIDRISERVTLGDWVNIRPNEPGKFKIILNENTKLDAIKIFGEDKADHRILNAAMVMKDQYPERKVVLVTKDINLRIKAKSLGLNAEDYETGKIKQIDDLLPNTMVREKISAATINKLYEQGSIPFQDVFEAKPISNNYFILKNGQKSVLSYFNPNTNCLEKINKANAYGIMPKNAEQTFAIHAIMNPEIKLVAIQGVAGTGKTLLSLAGALEMRRLYTQILLARPVVPLSNKDIGFLPGDIKSKLNPYMEPLWDNLKFIKNQFSEKDKEFKAINDMVEKEKILILPLAYIRGRSLSNVFFIVDEAQNLTPHEVKTIITRAGEGTKIIFTGDIFQIDTPYLDAQSNGLSYLIDKIKDHPLYAHVKLEKGERSELANIANELL
jgi:PhoH-like ATPase